MVKEGTGLEGGLSVISRWLILSLALVVVTAVVGVPFFHGMPSTVRFNLGNGAAGVPKALWVIFLIPIIQFAFAVIVALCGHFVKSGLRLHNPAASEGSVRRSQDYRSAMSKVIVYAGLALILLLGVGQLAVLGLISHRTLAVIMFCGTAITVAGVIVATLVLYRRYRPSKAAEEVDHDDPRFWRMGLFYFNPNDPSIFVEQRIGMSYINNFAHPVTWVMFGGLLVLVAGFLIWGFLFAQLGR